MLLYDTLTCTLLQLNFSGGVGYDIGFDDPSEATGTPEFINSEFHRVRDEIKARFYEFYLKELMPQLS